MSGQRSYLNFESFWGHQAADTIKLQSKIPNSTAEQTCTRVSMASKWTIAKCVWSAILHIPPFIINTYPPTALKSGMWPNVFQFKGMVLTQQISQWIFGYQLISAYI